MVCGVTEKAFFCFLCDRAYFEHISASGRSGQYSKEFTFFSDRLFVHYTPDQLRSYLGQIFPSDEVPQGTTRTVESRDRDFLPYVLLQSSCSSPIALRRKLTAFIDRENKYAL